jgi:hypothetical protein
MRRFRKKNPLGSTADLLLAGAGVAVLGLVGYAVYSKSQVLAGNTVAAPSNPFINAPNNSAAAYGAFNQGYSAGVTSMIQPPSGVSQ